MSQRLLFLTVVGAATFLASASVLALDPFPSFQSGTPIVASEVNSRFETLVTVISSLESQVSRLPALEARIGTLENEVSGLPALEARIGTLETQLAQARVELAEARRAAGYITLAGGRRVPYFRKQIVGPEELTDVTLVPHGIPGMPASGRRFIGCTVVNNYSSTQQTEALNVTGGASTPGWCDWDDVNLEIQWDTSSPGHSPFQVTLEYLE